MIQNIYTRFFTHLLYEQTGIINIVFEMHLFQSFDVLNHLEFQQFQDQNSNKKHILQSL